MSKLEGGNRFWLCGGRLTIRHPYTTAATSIYKMCTSIHSDTWEKKICHKAGDGWIKAKAVVNQDMNTQMCK